MAVYCQKCGKQHPDDANFCMKCGSPLKNVSATLQASPMRWEYKDIVINLLNVKVPNQADAWKRAAAYMNNLIIEGLRHEGQYGWQAEGPTDFQSLSYRDVVDYETHRNWLSGITGYTYRSVRIRLRRPATN